MLKRFYVDNFRCLVDVELNFDSINLFLGDNGSGKSTTFEALSKLQRLTTTDSNVRTIFKLSDYTRWQNPNFYSLDQNPDQVFELEFLGNGGIYKYELKINFWDQSEQGLDVSDIDSDGVVFAPHAKWISTTIKSERLWFNDELLLDIDGQKVKIVLDNGTINESSRYNFYQSIFPLLRSDDNNKKLLWFRNRMKRLVIIKIMPNVIANESSKESPFLSNNIENYVSWYRYIFDSSSALFNKNEEKPVNRLTQALQDIFDAFVGFRLEIISEKIVALKLMFANKDGYRNYDEYSLSELSDGEKNLIVLYSLFYGLESKDYTLCIDEPENFLALPEIQPWLFQLYDLCSEGKLQALLISHHPELINYLLASPVGYWFERESNSRVKVKPITNQESEESGLSMSELIARGWLNG
ncbi:MAG: ATPase [Snowella sp.]|jgi:AAA15 family ATPase/GTPase|nr:MAG: ATPase [Snowella sp.]